jgi:hypothetical protein
MPALRVETHPLGEVDRDMTDMRSREDSKKPIFSVGIAINWLIGRHNNAALRPLKTATVATSAGTGRSSRGFDSFSFVIDAHFRFFGLSVDAEYHWRKTDFHNFGRLVGDQTAENRSAPGDLSDNGASFKVGFMILPKQLDVAVRWSWVDMDEFWLGGSTDKRFALGPDIHEFGLAVGYYLHGHNLKIQADFTYADAQLAFSPSGAASGQIANPLTGRRIQRSASSYRGNGQDAASDHLQVFQFRVQIQWIF